MRRFLVGVIVGALLTAGVASASSGSIRILVNGREIVSDVPPQIINGRTMVPLRFVAEALGATVSWDATSRTVSLISGAGTLAAPSTPSSTSPSSPITPPSSSGASQISVAELILVGADGQYLGKLTTNKFDSESVYNEYGDYGSKYSSASIWNQYGDYGSKYSSKSAFNDFATDPPLIVADGEVIGRLTTNKYIPGAVSPYELQSFLIQLGQNVSNTQLLTPQTVQDVKEITCTQARKNFENLKNDMTSRGMLNSQVAQQAFENQMNASLADLGCSP